MSELLTVPLRYDGLDAEAHEIDLAALGLSLQGAARILAVTGNFATTGKYVSKRPAMDIRVVAREPRANCFTLEAILQFAQQQGLFQGGIGAILSALVTWLVARASNNKEEMKHLADSLNKAIEALSLDSADSRGQTMAVIDKMIEALRPAAKQMVAPIGRSCRQMSVGDYVVIDEATAEAIRGEDGDEVDQERQYEVLITELDLEKRTAKVRLDDKSEKRIRAIITDPAINIDGNAYASAFVMRRLIKVMAKSVLRDDEIRMLFISNSL